MRNEGPAVLESEKEADGLVRDGVRANEVGDGDREHVAVDGMKTNVVLWRKWKR